MPGRKSLGPLEDHVADRKIDTALAHEPADRRDGGYRYLAIILVGVLLQRDRVGALGHRRSGEDAHALARFDPPVDAPCPRRADFPQRHRQSARVAAAKGLAVHRRNGGWRMGDRGDGPDGEDAPERRRQRYRLLGGETHSRHDPSARLLDRQKAGSVASGDVAPAPDPPGRRPAGSLRRLSLRPVRPLQLYIPPNIAVERHMSERFARCSGLGKGRSLA